VWLCSIDEQVFLAKVHLQLLTGLYVECHQVLIEELYSMFKNYLTKLCSVSANTKFKIEYKDKLSNSIQYTVLIQESSK